MARWRGLAAGLATSLSVLALAACGGGHSTSHIGTSNVAQGVTCRHAAGECIKAELRAKHFALTPPATISSAPQGIDISNFQPSPNFGVAERVYGTRFALIQTNDGGFGNPFFWMQAIEAQNHGIPWGSYTFIEGANPVGQAQMSERMGTARGLHRSLGMWADAEIPAAYPVVCSYVREASRFTSIFGVYGSPGTYAGGRCPGYDWVARWGSGPAGSLPGYPVSATVVRQWCGTCRMPGVTSGEMDRDESLGLLSLVRTPESAAHRRARELRELRGHEEVLAKLRVELKHRRAKLERHGCTERRHLHKPLSPYCRHVFAAGDRVSAHGRYEDGAIKHLKAELAG